MAYISICMVRFYPDRFPLQWATAMIRGMTADEIKKALQLEPHPVEGGWFRQTYASSQMQKLARGPRHNATAIYYLLEEGSFSEMHMLPSDEVFHFYYGDPVEMLQLFPDGSSTVLTLGLDLAAGQVPQLVVPAGVWQGTHLLAGGKVALLGCTVSPGFDYADYSRASHAVLTQHWPQESERIRARTRS
jgi:uncharacterized protein